MEEETSTYTMRVPATLKKAFEQAAKANDQSGAQLVRKYMRDFVEWHMKNTAQGDMITPHRDKK